MLSAKAHDLKERSGGGQANGMSLRASARAQCQIGRGLDGETRGQSAPHLGPVPLLRRPEKRIFFQREQLLDLFGILGLAGRLGLRDEGSETSRRKITQGIR